MSLPSQTLRKFIRESFTGTQPILIKAADKKKFVADLKQRLAHFHNAITIDERHYSYIDKEQKEKLICTLSINNPNNERFSHTEVSVRLIINDNGELALDNYDEKTTISNLDELEAFINACQQRFERRNALGKKQAKIRDLKANAIIAQVKRLAKEEKFDFITATDDKKLRLMVKLSDKAHLELHIRFKDFEASLSNLRAVILSLKELHLLGISFKLNNNGYYTQWISHTKL